MRPQDRTLARALYGGRSSMAEHLDVTQGVVGSRPSVRPEAESIRIRHLCQGSSAAEHLALTICIPCPTGINSLLGHGSMVTGQEGGWFDSSPWRLEGRTIYAGIAQRQSKPSASLAHPDSSPFGPWQYGDQVVGSSPTPGSGGPKFAGYQPNISYLCTPLACLLSNRAGAGRLSL